MSSIKRCKKCKGTGINKELSTYWRRNIFCLECAGRGLFNLEQLLRYRVGKQIRNLRRQYLFNVKQICVRLQISYLDWRKIECGHFELHSLQLVLIALKKYTTNLEIVNIYTVYWNRKNKRSDHEELLTTTNLIQAENLVKKTANGSRGCQIVTQKTVVNISF